MSGEPLRLRQAARAIVIDPAWQVLLVRFDFPDRAVWACPGGGLEPGEEHEDALRRELGEELGLAIEDVGPCVWTRTHVIPFPNGLWDGQVERFHLVRVDGFEPRPRLSHEDLAAEGIGAVRWWDPVELERAGALIAPRAFVARLTELRATGVPERPIDVGV